MELVKLKQSLIDRIELNCKEYKLTNNRKLYEIKQFEICKDICREMLSILSPSIDNIIEYGLAYYAQYDYIFLAKYSGREDEQ